MFAGSNVALVTPFTKDASAVDFDKLTELIELQIAAGTNGIVPCGCTGEAATLSHDEQQEVIAFTVKAVKGRAKVIAGAGSNNTAESLRLSTFAAKAGADGVLVITPYYNKPMPEGQFRHYQAIADAIDIPVMLYNVPGRTGTKMTPETIARLYKTCKNITTIKEACGSVDQVSSIRQLCEIEILSGDDSLTLPMMSVGGVGVVSVAANIIPKEIVALTSAWLNGNLAEAQRLHYQVLPLCKAMFIETNPITVKTAMKLMGLYSGVLRMPLCEMTPAGEAALREVLVAYGLPLKS
ncbi:MAG: 4-hydroxy-tetrahydrodipicolinate synthase [Planctomycetes bacterium]|nr:4-hydroxy-tetrahydrodipicolinate synthase [Planctomycetota bacterium]